MKKLFLTLLFTLLMAAGVEARTYVLVAGVSNYGDENINLQQTTKDAKRFQRLMQNQTPDITLLTSSYATKENIIEKLHALCNRAGADDQIIFFFSGHGLPSCIYTYNGALSYQNIMDELNNSAAGTKICFIDACHAGSAAEAASTDDPYNQRIPNTALFVSSRPDEYSIESRRTGAGFFTQGLIKGLRGRADRNHDRKVTIKELFDYMYVDVVRRSESVQHPQLIAPREMYDVVIMEWPEANNSTEESADSVSAED